MKRQATASTVTEVELGVTTELPAGDTDTEEKTELSPLTEESTSPKEREIRPLTLVLTVLALALLFLIPLLLLMQRLQP
jgi:hypothetical protein